MALTDTALRTAKPRDKLYRLADAQGLCLEVTTAGGKLWRLRYRFEGKAKMLGLGGARELRFVPVIKGSKRAGVLQTIVGIALIVASFFVAPGSQAGFLAAGIGSTAGGVIQMLSPQATGLSQRGAPENLHSQRQPCPDLHRPSSLGRGHHFCIDRGPGRSLK